jgi:hypothetical protein
MPKRRKRIPAGPPKRKNYAAADQPPKPNNGPVTLYYVTGPVATQTHGSVVAALQAAEAAIRAFWPADDYELRMGHSDTPETPYTLANAVLAIDGRGGAGSINLQAVRISNAGDNFPASSIFRVHDGKTRTPSLLSTL